MANARRPTALARIGELNEVGSQRRIFLFKNILIDLYLGCHKTRIENARFGVGFWGTKIGNEHVLGLMPRGVKGGTCDIASSCSYGT